MALRFKIEQSPDGLVTSHSGMALVGLLVDRYTHLSKDLKDCLPYCRGVSHADVAKTYVGLMCQGKNDFEAVNGVQGDVFFQRALHIKRMPSEPTLRQRFDEHARDFVTCFDRAAVDLLVRSKVPISPLPTGHVALDIDGSPFDNSGTKREGVGRTYKGFDGYGAMMAYLGEEGWCVGAELRPGTAHGQFEFGYLLERVIPRVKRLTEEPVLVRLDSAHDAAQNRIDLAAAGVDYVVKWNPRKASVDEFVRYVDEHDVAWQQPREGQREAVFSLEVEHLEKATTHQWRRVMRIREETIDRKGQPLLIPKLTMDGWWTSLSEEEADDATVIRLYETHGTSEQFHSEFKTDLDMERFPSGKFDTNDLVLATGMLAYNVLRIIGQMTLTGDLLPVRHRAKRRRLRTVMQELIYLAARVVRSGRQWALQFSSHCPALPAFRFVYDDLWARPRRS